MEETLAILMADLSGYTALTEAHGAMSAADLIDTYVEIVNKSLVGNCILKERTGDQVMIVSESADDLLSTSVMILKNASLVDNFLQVHGGLHFGTVLSRNNSYFGSAINLTARIAAKAGPGSFWCSSDFVEALTDRSSFKLHPKGKHSFKNVNEEKEIAELLHDHAHHIYIDPICRMLILDKALAIPHPEDDEIYFCSAGCLEVFRKSCANSAE